MDFTPKPVTQAPVLWNWDQTNVVGTATVHANGRVDIDIVFTADIDKAKEYDLASDLKRRVDEWQPVRDFIKQEAAPTIMAQKDWLAMQAGERKVETYQEKARRLVFEYIKARLEKTDKHVTFSPDEVYVVWFAKTLQNWKCLISTTLPNGMYYEVTYNGDQHETYIDAYKKFDNVAVKDMDVDQFVPMQNLD